MSITPVPRPIPPSSGGIRQFQADFESNGALRGLNSTVRPDALVLNPLVSFSLGPVAEGNFSEGPVAYAWRARCDPLTGNVFLSRANNANTAWLPETLLFTITGVMPVEIDLTFDQSARANVAAERPTGAGGAPRVWLYYFNSLLPGFDFGDFGPGRTPRVILDNPQVPNESDVLLAYLNPVTDRLELRQQRDRFTIAYPAPLTAVTNTYLEETLWTEDNRLRIIYSMRDVGTGTYSLGILDSTMYPFLLPPEDYLRAGAPAALSTSQLVKTTITLGPPPFGTPGISEDGIVDPDNLRGLAPTVLATSTLAGGSIIITAVSTPARLTPEDFLRGTAPAVLNTSLLAGNRIDITATSTPARLIPEDFLRGAAPAVLNTSLLFNTLITVLPSSGAQRLPPEDFLRCVAPAVLNTSTLA